MDCRFEKAYSELFTVDYISDPQKFWIELPFTFVSWRMIEMISVLCNQTTLQATTMVLQLPFSRELAHTLSLNILPDCETLLHGITKNYEFINYFLEFTENREGEDPFVVPFIENMSGKTPLHISTEPETENSRCTEYFLTEFLPKQPLDHHGRAIADIIPALVEQESPYLGKYLDSRLITTK